MIEKLKGFFKLVRWFHELLAILPFVGLYAIIDYYAGKSQTGCELSGLHFFILCLCVQLLLAAGCVLNDIMDRHIDRVNKPHTHIIGRVISLPAAWAIFAVMSLMIALLSVYITCYVFSEWAWISAAVYILSILYDVYFKRSPLMGNILMAALASFIPLVLFFFAKDCIALLNNERIVTLIYLYCFYPFMIIIPRELSLDISDMEGDRADGCKTLPILIGAKRSKIVVTDLIITIIILSVPVACHYWYLAIVFGITDVLLIYYIYLLKRSKTRIEYIRAGRFLWFVMILGLVGFTVATVT